MVDCWFDCVGCICVYKITSRNDSSKNLASPGCDVKSNGSRAAGDSACFGL